MYIYNVPWTFFDSSVQLYCLIEQKFDFCRHIRYIGQSDIGDKSRNTLIRSCLDIGTSVNIGKFLSEMGFV